MEIKITCPYCEADNYVAEGRESVFCSACGEKIEINTPEELMLYIRGRKNWMMLTYMELQN